MWGLKVRITVGEYVRALAPRRTAISLILSITFHIALRTLRAAPSRAAPSTIPATVQFPSNYLGKYFFVDLCSAWDELHRPLESTCGQRRDRLCDGLGRLSGFSAGRDPMGVSTTFRARPAQSGKIS
jgi:hypothetical protein